MKQYYSLLVLCLLTSSFAFSQKRDNITINPKDFEKVQVELQKQAEIQKQLYLGKPRGIVI